MPKTDTVLTTHTTPADTHVQALARRMVAPLCGLVTTMGITAQRRHGPRFLLASGDLTRAHRLLNVEMPGTHSVGACGTSLEDVVLRTLAEGVERYCTMAAARTRTVLHARHQDMRTLSPSALFTTPQYARPGFPFTPYDPDDRLGWTPMRSLTDGTDWWVPAQFTLAGYALNRAADEPLLGPAVSTGTAAHTDPGRALLGALQELVQLDAVMGHWYTDAPAFKILPDARTRALYDTIEARWGPHTPRPQFHLLANPDLPGFSVVCLLSGTEAPVLSTGLGADFTLARAMYKALMEAVTLTTLCRWKLIERANGNTPPPPGDQIYDIENNALHYALPQHAPIVWERFARSRPVAASDLAPDTTGSPRVLARRLVDAFTGTGKQLLYADLSTRDARQLGFTVARVWSPDTLSLCLPSAPPAAHPRFTAYGDLTYNHPHPYP
ncbi:YcaO-like family protein [Actinomadura vinacea]|uniref:YcaO-like family protein n=1 Tax=Actinomadura vinacea TaxID=115336 RepID=A0ABN3K5M9_9ACTN